MLLEHADDLAERLKHRLQLERDMLRLQPLRIERFGGVAFGLTLPTEFLGAILAVLVIRPGGYGDTPSMTRLRIPSMYPCNFRSRRVPSSEASSSTDGAV